MLRGVRNWKTAYPGPQKNTGAFARLVLAFTVVSAIAIEFILLGQELSHATVKRLVITDAIPGAAAGLLLVVGQCRVFFFEKGPAHYFHSHPFLTKFSASPR